MCDKPKLEVGQIWKTNSPTFPYIRIVCVDRKDSKYPIIVCYSSTPEMKSEGVTYLRSDGTYDSIHPWGVTKLYVPKKTKKHTIRWWRSNRHTSHDWLTYLPLDLELYKGLGYTLVAERDIELTEGEGLDV